MFAAWLYGHYRTVWWSLFVLFGLPFSDMLLRLLRGELGINPLEALLRGTGRWALILLLLSLTVTPLRRVLTAAARARHARFGKRFSDWNWLVRLRRMIGLYSFFYASLHCAVFLHFDVAWSWQSALAEAREKPFLLAGASALILLLPLAATSTNSMMRLLGGRWRQLHRLSYAIAIVALVHFWWLIKVGESRPLPYTMVAVVLLGYRLLTRYGFLVPRPTDDGMETPERGTSARAFQALAARQWKWVSVSEGRGKATAKRADRSLRLRRSGH